MKPQVLPAYSVLHTEIKISMPTRDFFCASKGLSRSAAAEKETRWDKIGEAVVSVKGGEQGEEGRRWRVIIILISASSTLISDRMNNMSKQSLLKTHCKKSSFCIISLEIVRRQIHEVFHSIALHCPLLPQRITQTYLKTCEEAKSEK